MQKFIGNYLVPRHYSNKCTFCGGYSKCHYVYSTINEHAWLETYGIKEDRPDVVHGFRTLRVVHTTGRKKDEM